MGGYHPRCDPLAERGALVLTISLDIEPPARRQGKPQTERNLMSFKKNQSVIASTIRGAERAGTYVATHSTTKGDWIEIKPADGGPNFRTRPSLVTPA